jgi:hypothetical protein
MKFSSKIIYVAYIALGVAVLILFLRSAWLYQLIQSTGVDLTLEGWVIVALVSVIAILVKILISKSQS